MPVEAIVVPFSEDQREPTTLPPEAGQRLINVRSWRNGLQKFGGLTLLGNVDDLDAAPRNFFECVFPDGTRQLIALAAGTFHVWNGTTWGTNLSGAASRAVIPTPSNGRFSIVNTLGKVYIAAGGDNDIIVYDPTETPPADLEVLTSGLESSPANLSCRVILAFGDRLVLVRTVEDGVDFPTRIRWNALNNLPGNPNIPPTDAFDTTLTGAALREVIETSSEPLTGGFVLGERAFLTKAHEILELIPSENPEAVFAIESRISGTGLLAPYSVAVAQNIAFFLGSDNVFAFDGTQLTAIGDPILDSLSDLLEERGHNHLLPLGAIYPRRDEYWLLPGLLSDTAFVYNYRLNRWYEYEMATGAGQSGSGALGTISASLYSGGLETQTLVLNGSSSRSTSAFFLNEDVISRLDYSTFDGGDDVPCRVRTKQIFPKRKGFRGVVEPAATDKVNVLWEVSFKGAPKITNTVIGATNATPILITTEEAHGLRTGDTVRISGVLGNTAANGTFMIRVTSTTNFQLIDSVGTGAWTSGGTAVREVSVVVTATEADGTTQSQTVTTDAGGRGKAFFVFPWQCVDFTFENTDSEDFQLVGLIGYRWSEGGIHLPTDPA